MEGMSWWLLSGPILESRVGSSPGSRGFDGETPHATVLFCRLPHDTTHFQFWELSSKRTSDMRIAAARYGSHRYFDLPYALLTLPYLFYVICTIVHGFLDRVKQATSTSPSTLHLGTRILTTW